MLLIGLTGGIGTGKSTVSNVIKSSGIDVIDGDQIAREVVEPGTRSHEAILAHFGSEVFDADKKLNREKVGKIIFSDAKKRKLLNSITHPEIYKSIAWKCFLSLWNRRRFVVLDLPLLYESGTMVRFFDAIIVSKCSPDQQLDRLMARNGFSEEEASTRIASQLDLEEKCRRADYIIDNSGTLEETEIQVKLLLERIKTLSSKRYLVLDTFLFLLTAGLSMAFMKLFS